MEFGPEQESLLAGFLARICDKISLEGTLYAPVYKCCEGNNFNDCMGKLTMDGLGGLAEAGAAVTTIFTWGIGASFTANIFF